VRSAIVLSAALLFASVADAQTNDFTVTDIVTSSQDARLVNPWGLVRPPKQQQNNQWWAADEVSGLATLYTAYGTIIPFVVTVPPASGSGTGSPTGSASYLSTPVMAFVTLDGTISTWNAAEIPGTPGTQCHKCHVSTATIVVNNASRGASYQGLAIAKNVTSGNQTIYVANANAGVEAYDATSFDTVNLPTGAFTDPKIPKSYSPAGIQALGSRIFVTYNRTAGGGTGYVDGFDTNGKLLLRLQDGWFNQPWGVALTPANFGSFSDVILVANTGSGWIGVYSKTNGTFEGFLQSGGTDLKIPGLWGLGFGDGTSQAGPTHVLYFNAGGAKQTTGVFGAIAAN
jgi:uncharacterized protein (TIGR03118 family)